MALAVPAGAQNDYRFNRDTSGTFGTNLKLSLVGMPRNRLMVFMLSLNAGPTTLASLIGQDSRSLGVGTDLIPLWIYSNSGSGSPWIVALASTLEMSSRGLARRSAIRAER